MFSGQVKISEAQRTPEAPLQRAVGRLDLHFAQGQRGTVPVRLHQQGALKVRLPTVYDGGDCEAVVINTAGGVTGGDDFAIAANVADGAAVTLSAQACEKFYRSTGTDAHLNTSLTIARAARLHWLMQPAILFDRARVRRTCIAEIETGGEFLAVEALVFGRAAMQETMNAGLVVDRWQIRHGGKLVYADAFRVNGDIQAALSQSAALGTAHATASVIYVADDAAARRDEMRAILGALRSTAAASAWNGVLVTRLVAEDSYTLVKDLIHLITTFRGAPPPRVWMI